MSQQQYQPQKNSSLNNQSADSSEKKNRLIRLAITAGLAIILAVVTSFAILSKINKPDTQDTQKPKKDYVVHNAPAVQQPAAKSVLDREAVLNAIALSLFDSGLSNESIKENTLEDVDGKTQMHIVIDHGQANLDDLKTSIADKLAGMGANTEKGDKVTAQDDNMAVVIDFTGHKKAETGTTAPKSTNDKKSAVTPDASGDYSGVKVAFVIDDCGYSVPLAEKLAAVKYPLAMAIIPYTPHSKETADIVRRNGQMVFLHQPMQPKAYPSIDPGKGAILLNMPESLVDIWLKNNVADLGGRIDGFNNHMGSALTESSEKMDQVFTTMKRYTNFYVDSYTSPASVAFDECKKFGYICAQNRKFIDNESDPEYIKGKILEGLKVAKDKGSIIMIGHLRDNTVAVLTDFLPQMTKMGVKIVPVKELSVQ